MFKKILLSIVCPLLSIGFNVANADTLQGVIKGAQCHINKTSCIISKKDPHQVLENDFVLVTPSGYYFLNNVTRDVKLDILSMDVKISGSVSENIIDVSEVFIQNNGEYESVWNWDEIQYDLYEG